ncbi:membrane-associated protein, putative, partial [Bodo saltans]
SLRPDAATGTYVHAFAAWRGAAWGNASVQAAAALSCVAGISGVPASRLVYVSAAVVNMTELNATTHMPEVVERLNVTFIVSPRGSALGASSSGDLLLALSATNRWAFENLCSVGGLIMSEGVVTVAPASTSSTVAPTTSTSLFTPAPTTVPLSTSSSSVNSPSPTSTNVVTPTSASASPGPTSTQMTPTESSAPVTGTFAPTEGSSTTALPSNATFNAPEDAGGVSGGTIAGASIGAVIAIAVVAFVVIKCAKSNEAKQTVPPIEAADGMFTEVTLEMTNLEQMLLEAEDGKHVSL